MLAAEALSVPTYEPLLCVSTARWALLGLCGF